MIPRLLLLWMRSIKCSRGCVAILCPLIVLCVTMNAGAEGGSESDWLWQQLPGGMEWGVTEISQERNGHEAGWQAVDPQRPLIIKVSVRNDTNKAIEVPSAFYHGKADSGPALASGVTMHLLPQGRCSFGPFNPRSPDPNYPRENDYAPVKLIRDAHFEEGRHRTLAAGQSIEAFTLDLRDCFGLAQPGYYLFHFEFDRAKLQLPNGEVNGPSQVSVGFTVGVAPPRIMPAELNRTIDVLGGRDKPAELARLIERELPPALQQRPTTRPAMPAKLAAIDLVPRSSGGNTSPFEPEINGLIRGGLDVVRKFESYDPATVRKELERRLPEVQEPIGKLYVAAVAAQYGSRDGALYLLESCKAVDERTVGNTQSALACVLEGFDRDPPDWAVELALAVLSDQRYVIDSSGETSGTIGSFADDRADLPLILGHLKCRKAVDKLIELAKAPGYSSNAIMALGDIGDARAVPVLLGVLRELEGQVKMQQGMLGPDAFVRAAESLAYFKCREAVPILLRHVRHEEIIAAMESIGDPIAIPDLKKVAASPAPAGAGESERENDRDARDAARIALVTLSDVDPIPGYLKLLHDQTLNEFARRSVVWRLGDRRDPRSIGALIDAIHNDPSGAVVNQAITVLSVFKAKAAVEGLIGCFDGNFAGKQDWKRAYKPEMFRENIAKSLRSITGEKFGPDHDQWLAWWQRTGRLRTDIQ
jgi:HEAT repeat protein